MNDDADNEKYEIPRDVQTEQAVIGCVLLNNEVMDSVSRLVRPEHFFEPLHQMIFECISKIIADGRIATPLSVKVAMGDRDLGDDVNLSQYLARLAAMAPAVANAMDYAQIISDLHACRRIIEASKEMGERAYDMPVGVRPGQIAAGAIEILDDLVRESDTRNYRMSVGRAGQAALEKVQDVLVNGEPPGVPTGLRALDSKLGAMQAGDFVILAGRPGMGKSALALEIALNVAMREGSFVDLYSLEMKAPQIAQRNLSSLLLRAGRGAIPYKLIAQGKVSDGQLNDLWEAQRTLDRLYLEIDAQPRLTVSQIAARAKRKKQRARDRGLSLDLVIVDHIGIIGTYGRRDISREREVAEISAALKEMAKDLDCPVIAISQLSRRIEERKIEDRRPQMSDLRESGALEQDADIVIGLFREAYYLGQLSSPDDAQLSRLNSVRNTLECVILKNRMGSTGVTLQRCFIGSNYITDTVDDLQPSMIDKEPMDAFL